jgi:hypothetical protein
MSTFLTKEATRSVLRVPGLLPSLSAMHLGHPNGHLYRPSEKVSSRRYYGLQPHFKDPPQAEPIHRGIDTRPPTSNPLKLDESLSHEDWVLFRTALFADAVRQIDASGSIPLQQTNFGL